MLNYYKVLNVDRNCSISELKKAYRIAALFWHPDKNKSSQAHEMFINITEAYNILIDGNKRNIYDQLLQEETQITNYNTTQQENKKFYSQKQEYAQWRQAARTDAEKLSKLASDKILTETFHFIDSYGWVIFLIIFIIFTIIAFAIRS